LVGGNDIEDELTGMLREQSTDERLRGLHGWLLFRSDWGLRMAIDGHQHTGR